VVEDDAEVGVSVNELDRGGELIVGNEEVEGEIAVRELIETFVKIIIC